MSIDESTVVVSVRIIVARGGRGGGGARGRMQAVVRVAVRVVAAGGVIVKM